MPKLLHLILLVCLLLTATPAVFSHSEAGTPLTLRPERTNWRETSTSAEVIDLLQQVAAQNPRMHFTTFGESGQGRSLPLLIVGPVSPAEATPEAVRASGKLRVYLKGNIHAGEVAGKEALLQLVRELALGQHHAWQRELVLLIGPNYNPDGNEALDLRHRLLQHGPVAGMGTRENAQGLDLNRDIMKLDTPESRAFVRLLNQWDPHVVVDLHTTNGSHHAYHLTYAPGLHPSTPSLLDNFLRDELLPTVTRQTKSRWGWHLWHYGVVGERHGLRGWWTFDARPRYVTNYIGVRGRLPILSEAYAYLTFADRTLATKRFLITVLDQLTAHPDTVIELIDRQTENDRATLPGTRIPLRGKLPSNPRSHDVLMGAVTHDTHPLTGETILRRLDEVRPERMPAATSFEASDWVEVPEAYLLSSDAEKIVAHLRLHGVVVEALPPGWQASLQPFQITSDQESSRLFQGHHERSVTGTWEKPEITTLPNGGFRISLRQPLARLALLLLEPTADDGLLNWGFFNPWLNTNRPLPLWRETVPQSFSGTDANSLP